MTAGRVTLRLRERGADESYDVELSASEAAVSEPGTLLQLRNDHDVVAEVLYIVSPSYAFEIDEGHPPRYDDAVPVADTWEDLEARGFDIPQWRKPAYEYRAEHDESMRRLAAMQGYGPAPLAGDDVVGIGDDYDEVASGGWELRRLATGDNAQMTHWRLPAGATAAEVRNRTTEQLWFVLAGAGEVWRHRDGEPPRIDAVRPGGSLRVPVGTSVQVRADDASDIELVGATAPPSPGPRESVPADGGLGHPSGA